MPIMKKVRVKKTDLGEYRRVDTGMRVRLLPKDQLKHQSAPVGTEFEIIMPSEPAAAKLFRRAKK